ncbi:PDZ domain-containing protein [Halioxenophilus aromaticivorans]|uniref:PDZ domain-containing protein n=1 Tax=Halioxenophilus aromaticivorans TaxID=1306992 RepID=A0AAV3U294_9ALTE
MIKMIFPLLAILTLQACTVTKSQQLVNYAGEISECKSTVEGLPAFDPGAHITANRNLRIVCESRAKTGWYPAENAGRVVITTIQAGERVVVQSVGESVVSVRAQDIILSIDGEAVNNAEEAKKYLFGKVGSPVNITVLRDNKAVIVTEHRSK